ncbi:MAG: hypothetical protein MI974_27860 [Chitinophagales bacterium]|nr:hypothetical protein [Chitinophagales bacterium]
MKAQDAHYTKNELRLNLLRLEVVPESINDIHMFKWMNGVVYKRYFGKYFSALTGLEYGNREINDQKPSYEYAYEGKGKFKEFRLQAGFSFQLRNHAKFQPFTEGITYSSWTSYQGTFVSNQNRHQVEVDNTYIRIGAILKTGITYSFRPNLNINAAFGLRLENPGTGEITKTGFSTINADRQFTWIPLELSFSYLL